jgi:hypothetical protein
MEGIVKAIGRSEYNMAGMLILLDNLTQGDLERLLYFFVYKLIDKKITEPMFAEMIDYMNRTKMDFSSLKHIRQITELLNDENYNIGSELLIVLCDIKGIGRELSKFINSVAKSEGTLCNRIKGILSNDADGLCSVAYNFEVIIKSYSIVSEADKYIRSFSKLAICAYPSNCSKSTDEIVDGILVDSKSKYSSKYLMEQFEGYCRDEVLNRLILLKNYFGIYFLANVNIDVITVSDFTNMKYSDTIKYYFECVAKIKRSTSNHIRMYKNYIGLYEHYNNLISDEFAELGDDSGSLMSEISITKDQKLEDLNLESLNLESLNLESLNLEDVNIEGCTRKGEQIGNYDESNILTKMLKELESKN